MAQFQPPRPHDILPVAPSDSTRAMLATFLRRNRDRAIAEWTQALRAIPAALMLDPAELRDHMPALIDRVLALVDTPPAVAVGDLPELHAIVRLQEGFNLEQVAWEYTVLRSILLRLNEHEASSLDATELILLNDAIDQAVVRAVGKFHRTRVRMLEALERIAAEGLLAEPEPLQALLYRLLKVIMDNVETVDTAVLFLREWDQLVLRAAIGLEESVVDKFSLRVGEGFAGTVAETRRPLLTHSAETDPLVRNDVLRMSGVKALYGVPLIYGDDVVGVAKIGSRRASDFTAEDRQILRSAADRAAAFIAQRRETDDRDLILHILGHDLRSPLSTIIVAASRARSMERSSSPETARFIERVTSAAQRMNQLITDLTEYTQARGSAQPPLHREKVSLSDLVEELVRDVEARFDRTLDVDLRGDLTGDWDRARMQRLLVNLVNNAIAYGDPAKPIAVRVEGDRDTVTLRVHNDGEPIPARLIPDIFEPFKRGIRGSGAGLGLYIVRRIARSHGGDVEVESSANTGTTFTIKLPRRAPAEEKTGPARASPVA